MFHNIISKIQREVICVASIIIKFIKYKSNELACCCIPVDILGSGYTADKKDLSAYKALGVCEAQNLMLRFMVYLGEQCWTGTGCELFD